MKTKEGELNHFTRLTTVAWLMCLACPVCVLQGEAWNKRGGKKMERDADSGTHYSIGWALDAACRGWRLEKF